MEKGKIIIERKRRFSESKYSVGIYIDGEFIVNTINDNYQEIEVAPGIHVLKVEQALRWGELEIDVKKGKVTTYQFSARPLIYLKYAAFLAGWVLSYEVRNLLVFIPYLLLVIYTRTLGRNTHFIFEKIGEDESWLHDLGKQGTD